MFARTWVPASVTRLSSGRTSRTGTRGCESGGSRGEDPETGAVEATTTRRLPSGDHDKSQQHRRARRAEPSPKPAGVPVSSNGETLTATSSGTRGPRGRDQHQPRSPVRRPRTTQPARDRSAPGRPGARRPGTTGGERQKRQSGVLLTPSLPLPCPRRAGHACGRTAGQSHENGAKPQRHTNAKRPSGPKAGTRKSDENRRIGRNGDDGRRRARARSDRRHDHADREPGAMDTRNRRLGQRREMRTWRL